MDWQLATGAVLLALCSAPVLADDRQPHRHGAHDAHSMEGHGAHAGAAAHIHHQHPAGAWMLEYRMMRMDMDGLLNGTDRVATSTVSGALPGMPPVPDPARPYRMAPTGMTMDMHMLMLMAGLSDRLSLMAMATYRANDMAMVMHMPSTDMSGGMQTSGFGDTLVGLMASASERLTVSLSLSLPTGDIDQYVDTSMRSGSMEISRRLKAGYPMQLGSGTWDLVPAFTYARHGDSIGAGLQGSYTWRIGRNDNGYALGDVIEVIGWAKHAFHPRWLGALKLTFRDWGRIDGRDPELDPSLAPTADPAASGGTRLDASVGINAFFGRGHSLGIEFGLPVYQDLNGPQMRLNWLLSFTYQHM